MDTKRIIAGIAVGATLLTGAGMVGHGTANSKMVK